MTLAFFSISRAYTTRVGMGIPDENGTYHDGYIADLQDHKVDMVVAIARMDTLKYDPIFVGPVAFVSDK